MIGRKTQYRSKISKSPQAEVIPLSPLLLSDKTRPPPPPLSHPSLWIGILSSTEGTFPFYSPEMCAEASSSYSAYMADTWAATVCLWIFIFGELPFSHRDVTVLFQQIR
jgi:hypothetical protein